MKKILLFVAVFLISIATWCQTVIRPEDAAKHINETVKVYGKILGARYLDHSGTKPTLLNIGKALPDQLLTIVITDSNRRKFSYKPEEYLLNRNVWVTGKLVEYNKKLRIEISGPADIKIDEGEASPDTL